MAKEVGKDFPILSRKVHGKRLVYLDSAATSQKPESVLDAERAYYETMNANVHRGVHTLSAEATEAYENARKKVAAFINSSPEEIIFTRNATEGINLVSKTFGMANLKRGDLIVLTVMEHHSNIVPWQQLANERGALLAFVDIDGRGVLDQQQYLSFLKKKPKIVVFTQISNVLGTLNPVKEMTRRAHDAGAVVLVDACQSVSHTAIDVKDIGCDFLVFSGHKMLGPTGIGALYGRKELLEHMPPFLVGGDMIREVTLSKSTWNDVPHKFEAGTPNVAGAIGLAAAVDYLQTYGMDKVAGHVRTLTDYALRQLKKVPGISILGSDDRIGLVSFVMEGIPPHDVASILDDHGVAVRSGHHCAMPLHARLGLESSVRASFQIYNTKEDIDVLVDALLHCRKVFGL
jgi:cysteine desulfurase/selenocysteine lyase